MRTGAEVDNAREAVPVLSYSVQTIAYCSMLCLVMRNHVRQSRAPAPVRERVDEMNKLLLRAACNVEAHINEFRLRFAGTSASRIISRQQAADARVVLRELLLMQPHANFSRRQRLNSPSRSSMTPT